MTYDGAPHSHHLARGEDPGAASDGAKPKTVWWYAPIFVVCGLVSSFLLLSVGYTLDARFNTPSYADADSRGSAVVGTCDRRGPISLGGNGFGHYQACNVTVTWDNGDKDARLINQADLFRGLSSGDSFRIGVHHVDISARGSYTEYSRQGLPHRSWVGVVAWIFLLPGALILIAMAIYLLWGIKTLIVG